MIADQVQAKWMTFLSLLQPARSELAEETCELGHTQPLTPSTKSALQSRLSPTIWRTTQLEEAIQRHSLEACVAVSNTLRKPGCADHVETTSLSTPFQGEDDQRQDSDWFSTNTF